MEEIANFLSIKLFLDAIVLLGPVTGVLLVGLLPIYMHIYVYRKGVFKNKVDAILFFFFSFLLSFFITAFMIVVCAKVKSGF